MDCLPPSNYLPRSLSRRLSDAIGRLVVALEVTGEDVTNAESPLAELGLGWVAPKAKCARSFHATTYFRRCNRRATPSLRL